MRTEMDTFKNSFLSLILCLLLVSCGREFSFSPETIISVEDERQMAVAEWFAWLFAIPGGFVPKVELDAFGADVVLRRDSSLEGSSYRIKTTGHKACIEASSPAGFFYALQFIRHALPKDITSVRHADNVKWILPAMSIHSGPDTYCSGLLLDLSCRLVLKDNVLHLIESMPYMKVYELTIINDSCYSPADLNEIRQCAVKHNVELISQAEINGFGSN